MKKALLLLLVSACPLLAAAQGTSALSLPTLRWNLLDHFLFSNRQDPAQSDRTNALQHEDKVTLESERTTAGVQFSNQFAGPAEQTRPLVLEKKYLQAKGEGWRLRAGDSPVELGRGISLALYEDPVFGISNTVEGVKAEATFSSGEGVVFGGRLNSLQSPVALNPQENPLKNQDIWLGGVGLYSKGSPATRAGVHYFSAHQRDLGVDAFSKRWQTVGVLWEKQGLLEDVDTYIESNLLHTDYMGGLAVQVPNGWGSYASVTWVPLPWKIKIEAKDYRDYRFEFRRAPTLEEDIIVSKNTENVSAVKLTTERRNGSAALTASYLLGEDRQKSSSLHHGVIGAKGNWGELPLEAKGGYRVFPGSADLVHASLKVKAGATEFEVRKQLARSNLGSVPLVEDRNLLNVTHTFSETFSLGLGYEYLPENDAETGRHFANLSLVYKAGAFSARSLLGSTSGGTQCSGGVCRQVSPYSGFMVDTAYRF